MFHQYPDGTLMSLRKADVKKISMISAAAEQANTTAQPLIQIGNLAMQGGGAQAAPAARPAARAKTEPLGSRDRLLQRHHSG